MKNAVIACLVLCSGCIIDREIGGLDPGRLGGARPPAGPPPPAMIPPPPRSSDPCCSVGPRVALDAGEMNRQGYGGYGVWDGERWAVAWQQNQQGPASRIE